MSSSSHPTTPSSSSSSTSSFSATTTTTTPYYSNNLQSLSSTSSIHYNLISGKHSIKTLCKYHFDLYCIRRCMLGDNTIPYHRLKSDDLMLIENMSVHSLSSEILSEKYEKIEKKQEEINNQIIVAHDPSIIVEGGGGGGGGDSITNIINGGGGGGIEDLHHDESFGEKLDGDENITDNLMTLSKTSLKDSNIMIKLNDLEIGSSPILLTLETPHLGNNLYTGDQLIDFEHVKLSMEQRVLACIEYGYLDELVRLLDSIKNNTYPVSPRVATSSSPSSGGSSTNSSNATNSLFVPSSSSSGGGILFDINQIFRDKTKNDRSLLHIASRFGHTHIIEHLIDKYGANPNIFDKSDSTPIFLASAHGHTDACHVLASKGAQLNIRDAYENFPLGIALSGGFFETADALILFGADVNFKGKRGNTILHDACESNDWNRVQFILRQQNINIATKNRFEENCLFCSLPFPSLLYKLCDWFCKNYALDEFQRWIRSDDQLGKSLLHTCAQQGYFISFCILIQFIPLDRIQAFLNFKDRVKGNTVLHYIVNLVGTSISNVVNSNIITPTNGSEPIDSATIISTPTVNNSNFSFQNSNENDSSADNNSNSSSDSPSYYGDNSSSTANTPVHIPFSASKCYLYNHDIPNEAFFWVLISSNEMSIDEQNNDGETALHLALKLNNASTSNLLITVGGANVKIQNKQHKSCKKIAKEMGIIISDDTKDSSRFAGLFKKITKNRESGQSSGSATPHRQTSSMDDFSAVLNGSNNNYSSSNSSNQSGGGGTLQTSTQSQHLITINNLTVLPREQLVAWTNQLGFNLGVIDTCYMKLFDTINNLTKSIFRMAKANKNVSLVEWNIGIYILEDAIQSLQESFDAEKRLFIECLLKNDLLEDHFKEHDKFFDIIQELHNEFKQNGSEFILEEFLLYLLAHINEHYLTTDRTLAMHVKAFRIAPLPEENELMLEFL